MITTQPIKESYSVETEEIALSALIMESDSIIKVLDILTPEMFSDNRCSIIYKHILKLYDNGSVCDIMILNDLLVRTGNHERAGGFSYLVEITTKISSAAHIEYHAAIIYQFYFKRQLSQIFSLSQAKLNSGEVEDVFDLFNETMNKLDGISTQLITSGMKHISEIMPAALESIYKRVEKYRSGLIGGFNTGIEKLNKATGGWEGNQLIVLAGRPGMGKTAMLLHFAISAAVDQSKHICVYSLEMSRESLIDRVIHRDTTIDPANYKSGNLNQYDLEQIEKSISTLNDYNIHFDDKAGCNLRYISSNSKLQHKKGLCDMIIIDYLQIMEMTYSGMSREQSVSKTTADLKKLAKELNVPIIILAQLSREVEKRQDKTPLLSDLRESGAIEQDADMVIFIYRPAYYGIESMDRDNDKINTSGYGELIIAKQRNGETGIVPFKHNESLTKISDFEEVNTFMKIENIQKF